MNKKWQIQSFFINFFFFTANAQKLVLSISSYFYCANTSISVFECVLIDAKNMNYRAF